MMFKPDEIVKLNGKNYRISQVEWSKGSKACMLCAGINNRPPCIDAFDYPEKMDMFNSRQCAMNMPEFHIPKLVKVT